ncbi:inosine-uridine nucleoside N-ribohydrolase [Inhella inkyongensis]|uniref:Inosine-uridine nucleoside N-ribohydrolase n=1 Tax=Inhella inkyongensis TaxID=392593 RepID=A0A840S4R1_9BURK|nr:nucleoside hydrolase [Inhella inkyongensis]MBB5206297.1 inosine-uridine nucleoside N-ribohydrolase [Inhella inkyongensis]
MKLWFDTDPGVDDALALALILARPEFELLGLSTVFGNVSVETTTANALRLLTLLGHPDLPVHAGAEAPLQGRPRYATEVHGNDGLGGCAALLPPAACAAQAESGVEALLQASRIHAGALHLVAVGPLTNVALALRADPELPQRLASFTVMGAAFGLHGFSGNVTVCAEANIYNDALAASEVFACHWPALRVIGLDATQRVAMPLEALEPLRQAGPAARLLWQALQPYAGYYATRDGRAALVAHDATAVAALLAPQAFHWRRGPIRVVQGGLAHGQTVQDWQRLGQGDPQWDALPHHEVAIDADDELLSQLCLRAWTTY